MSIERVDLTRQAYEDPEVVQGYVNEHSLKPKLAEQVKEFAQALPGVRVIDVGCGPGQDARVFESLGSEVSAIDYSGEMIRVARELSRGLKIKYQQMDMRELSESFDENSFDGAWISASLLHISADDVPLVLSGVHKIVVPEGKVYIGLKRGTSGSRLVREQKYGKDMEREFTFWDRGEFGDLAVAQGFAIDEVVESAGGTTGGVETSWLNYYLSVKK